MPTSVEVDPETIELAACLLLDVADYLRQPQTTSVTENAMQAGLRKRINKQLARQKQVGDPLDIVETVREMVAQVKRCGRS